MSSDNGDTPKTTITSLPTELISRIVRLSSPKPSWDSATERFKHLRNLALVCRALRGPAQEELYRHVVLRSIAASRAFVAVLKSRAGARFASIPRSLRAGVDRRDRTRQEKLAISFIAHRCSRLESMWLLKIDRLDIAVVTSGTDLKELYCFECDIDTSVHGRKLEARALTRLGLRDCGRSYNLDPQVFPVLTSLDTSTPDPLRISLVTFINSVGRQLSSLGTTFVRTQRSDFNLEPTFLSNLLILDIGLPPGDVTPFLSSIPSRIRHLRAQPLTPPISAYSWATTFIEEHLEGSKYPCLEGLEHFRFSSEEYGREIDEATFLEAELAEQRPKVRPSFDDKEERSITDYLKSVDAKFNPAFRAFVDDAEAEEANRLEGA